MKKRNVMIHTAIATALLAMLSSAQATTVSAGTAPVFAKELLQGSTPNATNLTLNSVTVTANVALPANSTVYVYVKLNGASYSSFPVISAGGTARVISDADGTGSSAGGAAKTLTAASLGNTTGTANPTALGAGVDYVVFELKTNADVIGVGGTIAVLTGITANNAAALLTAPITVVGSVGLGMPTSRFGTLPASSSNQDVSSTAINLATQAQGINFALAASTNAGKIDLSATPSAALFDSAAINTNTINLGTLTATDGTAKQADGAAAYTIASQVGAANKLTAALTVPAGFFAPLGTTGQLWLQATCGAAGATGGANAGALAGTPSTLFTSAALAAAATSLTLTATTAPTSGTALNVCMGINKSTAAIAGTPTVVGTLIHTGTAVDSNETVSGSLYALVSNGSQRDVRSYIPAVTVGYTSFVRVINTGSIAAAVTGQWLYENGTSSTAATLISTLAGGASSTLTATQVEAALGAPAVIGTNRPRLRLTAPTNGMDAQSFFLTNANGNFSDVTGAQ